MQPKPLSLCVRRTRITLSPLTIFYQIVLDPVYTVPDPEGHDIILDTCKTSVAPKFMIILQNLTAANQRKSGESKYKRKLTKLDVVTTRIRYRVTVS